jgi:hypothetical protein
MKNRLKRFESFSLEQNNPHLNTAIEKIESVVKDMADQYTSSYTKTERPEFLVEFKDEFFDKSDKLWYNNMAKHIKHYLNDEENLKDWGLEKLQDSIYAYLTLDERDAFFDLKNGDDEDDQIYATVYIKELFDRIFPKEYLGALKHDIYTILCEVLDESGIAK